MIHNTSSTTRQRLLATCSRRATSRQATCAGQTRRRRGAVTAAGMILVIMLASLAAIVGLSMIRDQVTQEFGDAAVGLDQLDQSFSYRIEVDGQECAQAAYDDPSPTLTDPQDAPPAGLTFTLPDSSETGTAPSPKGLFP